MSFELFQINKYRPPNSENVVRISVLAFEIFSQKAIMIRGDVKHCTSSDASWFYEVINELFFENKYTHRIDDF